MTTRKLPGDIALALAVRNFINTPHKDRRPGIPTRGRPKIQLTVCKPQPGQPPDPGSGTLTIDKPTAAFYVGRGWYPPPGGISDFAESLRGLDVLEIVSTTVVAGERARKRIRTAWRIADIVASGRVPGAAGQCIADALKTL
jgi:hypothetical protein